MGSKNKKSKHKRFVNECYLFNLIFVFSIQLTVKHSIRKYCRWLDSNCGAKELENDRYTNWATNTDGISLGARDLISFFPYFFCWKLFLFSRSLQQSLSLSLLNYAQVHQSQYLIMHCFLLQKWMLAWVDYFWQFFNDNISRVKTKKCMCT